MFLLAVVFIIGYTEGTGTRTTYRHIDPSTGQELTCNLCPPGYHLSEHCTSVRQTECTLCPKGHYTALSNYISECLFCDTCYYNQVVKQACSPYNNEICECGDGYYWHGNNYCKRHTVCAPGYAVKSKGTPNNNTVCERCSDGSYAAGVPGHATCTAHTSCDNNRQRRLLRGTSWHDNVCVTCEDLRTKGWLAFVRDVLADFFAQQKFSLKKLQAFVRRSLSDARGRQQDRASHQQYSVTRLQEKLRLWLSNASTQEVENLPSLLRNVPFLSAADKLQHILTKIHREVQHCHSNTTEISNLAFLHRGNFS